MIGLISPSKFQSTLPARGATLISAAFGAQLVFQSTLPARGATTSGNVSKEYVDISIHAPRTGSDNLRQCLYPPEAHFNPRSPHGERPQLYCEIFDHTNFNPRSPHGERLRPNRYPRAPLYFNPRSPHGERLKQRLTLAVFLDFNPRSPHGERLRHLHYLSDKD